MLADLCGMGLDLDSGRGSFQPFLVMNGRRSLLPEDLSQGEVTAIAALSEDPCVPPLLRARLSDVAWLRVTPRDPKYDYWPCGRLRIDILDSRLARRMWSDTDGRLLERILRQVIVGIEADAEDRKRRRNEEELRRAEADRQRAERLKQEAAARRKQRLSEYQHLLARDLNRIAAKWAEARQVRDFVEAFDAAVPKDQRTDPVERWIDAARKYAMRLDPLDDWGLVARELEPSDENLDAAIAELRKVEEGLKRG